MPLVDQTSLELRSLVKQDGALELSLAQVIVSPPKEDEVIVRVEAARDTNPSDLGLLLATRRSSLAKVSGKGRQTVVTAPIAPAAMRTLSARIGKSMPVGLEAAGVVTNAGSSPEAQAQIGKTLSIFVGGTYGQLRKAKIADCLVLPPGIKPEEAASALVESANRSWNAGDRENGATQGPRAYGSCVEPGPNTKPTLSGGCDSTGEHRPQRRAGPNLEGPWSGAYRQLGSGKLQERFGLGPQGNQGDLAFDAVAGETSLRWPDPQRYGGRRCRVVREPYNLYGSSIHKQVYIYGALDPGPIELARGSGMAWSIGGWLLFHFLANVGPKVEARLKARVANENPDDFRQPLHPHHLPA